MRPYYRLVAQCIPALLLFSGVAAQAAGESATPNISPPDRQHLPLFTGSVASRAVPALTGSTATKSSPEGMPISLITVIHSERIDHDLVMSLLGVREGDSYSLRRIKRGIRRLERLSAVDAVELRTVIDEGTGSVTLFFIISEADTRSILPLVTREVTNDWSFGAVFSESNMRGVDERLTFDAYAGGAVILRAGYFKPSFRSATYLGIGFPVRYTYYEYPYPDYQDLLIDGDIHRLRATLPMDLSWNHLLFLRIAPGLDYFDVADSMLAGQGTGMIPDQPNGAFSTLEVGIGSRRLDRRFYPSRGYELYCARRDWGVFEGDAEIENHLYRYAVSLYFTYRRGILFLHSRGTTVRGGEVPLLLREHLGGPGSIRGYDFGSFSGDNSLFGSAELRVPLNFTSPREMGNPIILTDFHIFIDSGACWSDPAELDTELFRSGYGCGMNFIFARNVLLKVDYAWHRKSSGRWQVYVETGFW